MINQDLKLKGVYTFTLEDIFTGKKRVFHYENLIPTVGRTAIADHLTNASPSPSALRATYTALGSGTTAPANGDTTLQTETYRKAIASQTKSNNIAYMTAFYTAAEAVATHREAGVFLGGSIAANSGTLFSRVAINITKGATETLTIDYSITIS